VELPQAVSARAAADGIPTVPTLWLDQGCADARAQLKARGWGEVVVKPAVSIGAIGALRADAADPACLAHLDRLVADGDVMVQPFVTSVAEAGEVSLVYFGGRFSHAIRKQPAAGDFRVQDMYGGTVHPTSPPGPSWRWPTRCSPARRRPPPTRASTWWSSPAPRR
jgi:glutathione synthase/RimK-type ligase-like ATP-grasp enzyme